MSEPFGAGRPLRVAIVDDEPLARDSMRLALQRLPGVIVVAECEDGLSAVDAIRETKPDLVFLDVQMPGLDGFGVIERVGVARMPAVVFVTAFDAHAIRAFEVHAVDYVLKPFEDRRLHAALDRARSLREGELGRRLAKVIREWQGAASGLGAESEELGATAFGNHETLEDEGGALERAGRAGDSASFIERFAVRADGRIRFVQATDVDWIEADGNYVVMHVGDATHRIRASLREVIGQLDPKLFMRVHRSTIVNVQRIREVQPWFGGDYIAIMRNGIKLKVSRQRAASLLRPMA